MCVVLLVPTSMTKSSIHDSQTMVMPFAVVVNVWPVARGLQPLNDLNWFP